jgi:flagellar L-ring protein precursor FlgH
MFGFRVLSAAVVLLTLLPCSVLAQAPPFDPRDAQRRPADLVFEDEPVYVMDRPMPALSVRDLDWGYIDPPLAPRRVQLHDIISIVVDEKSEVTLRSAFNRQRTNTLKAELLEWIRIGKRNRLENAAANEPTIDGNLTDRIQSSGIVTDQEGIRYRIAATVVNVLPNGNVVLEARKSIRTDRDVWRFSLTGVIASHNIRRDMTALSENIANLDVVKTRSGKVHSSTKTRWGTRLYDLLWPF